MTRLDDLPLFLTQAQAARLLGVSRTTLRKMVADGDVPIHVDGNGWKRYPTRALIRWTEQMQAPKAAS